jgi:hypothetical protein
LCVPINFTRNEVLITRHAADIAAMVRFITDTRTRPAPESASLEVIGAGLPRSATSSLQAAFEILGCDPCLHMAQILPHPDRQRVLLAGVRESDTARRQKLVRDLVSGYRAICDFPVAFFGPDLMDMYPDAKVVLNARPSGAVWEASAWESFSFFFGPWFMLTGLLWTTDRLWYQLNMEAVRWIQREFGARDVRDCFSATSHDRYYEYMRREARTRGRHVLEFKAEDGWEPLCSFLGKEVPDVPFPRMNEKKTFAMVKAIFIAKGLLSWAALFGSIWAGWRFGPAAVNVIRARLP